MRARREKWLCYNCDEKYVRGHKCNWRFLLLIKEDDEGDFMQGENFVINLYILQIQGQDVLLEVQWLQILGRITQDFSRMTMEFANEDRPIIIQESISFNKLQALFDKKDVCALYELCQIPLSNSTRLEENDKGKLEDVPNEFQQLIQEFSKLFETPKVLPLHRVFDHKIHLWSMFVHIDILTFKSQRWKG